MNDIYSKEFQRKYQKSKYKLRQWEDRFLAENGRLPTRADIKVSPASIKEYYKVYWKLKTQILEAQILSEDVPSENHTFIRSNSEGVLKEHSNNLNAIKKNDLPVLRTANGSKENICQSQPKPVDLETWGAHLNRNKTIPNPSAEKTTFLNDVIAGRLFKGSSFKKRNPRKALSFSKKKSNKSLTSEDDCKASQELGCPSPFFDSQESSFSVDQSLNDSSFCADASIGEAFFSGNKDASFSVENNCSPNIKALITSATSLSPILNKCSMAEEKTVTTVQPVSLIQAIASDPSVVLKSVRNIDSGWVERCTEGEQESERKSSLDSGFDSMELTLPESDSKEGGKDSESDDDLIGSSDNEVDHNDKLSCSFLSQKRKAEELRGTEEANSRGEEKTPSPKAIKKIKVDPYEFVDEGSPKTVESIKESVLMKKMKSGTANENYVKINLKKKVYVRGKKNFSFCRYKKQEWKNKKKNLIGEKETGDVVRCFKCGDAGHFSRYCNKGEQDKLLPFDEDEGDGLPTLEEAEAIAKEESLWRKNNFFLEVAVAEDESTAKVEPLYQLNEDGSLMETPMEVLKALHKFGHSEFRPGQEATIMRILSGQSTLLTIATGGGKSLCYQLPAYLYANRCKCITLVVSPLVSLMEDQVSGSSSFFKVGCLHTNQTQKQRQVVLEDAKNGTLFALLISPEAVVSGDSSAGFGSILKQLPPIAFACIDEVHCVSQWSHNFRPSYLMISKVLREKLGISTILGLTATATVPTIRSITSTLHIPSEEGVIRDIPLPDNLCLSVSRDENKDRALLQLLQSARFKDSNAILIYCTRRDECERLAVLIRTVLHDPNRQTQSKTKRLSWNAESYHAGMAAARRKQVQKAFMCGNLRIVVATIAFGMGINKQDIRGVIHYNMPKDFESYVQEVGRAGRDGMLAHCHLFLDSKGRDLNELRRHVHSDSVDRFVLRKLLQKVFVDCECKAKSMRCEGHEVAFDCKDTIQTLDIPEENIHTLLCYLELHEKKFAKVLAPTYMTAKIRSYKGMKALHAAARKCPPLAYACALRSKSKQGNSSSLEFNVIDVANKLSWSSEQVKSELKNLEWEVTGQNRWKRTGIAVDFSGLGFRVFSKGDLTPSELDEALDYLIQRVENQEKRSSAQLDITFSTFDHFAEDNCASCMDDVDRPKSIELKNAIRKYFETEEISPLIPLKKLEVEDFDEEALAADVRVLLCTYRDNTFNGRAVARIFHGIQSPNYPASLWCKCRFWRQHLDKDFKKISRIATREILRLKI